MNCGCRIVHKEVKGLDHRYELAVEFCPLHAAAEKLLEAAKELDGLVESNWIEGINMNVLENIREAIAEAERDE